MLVYIVTSIRLLRTKFPPVSLYSLYAIYIYVVFTNGDFYLHFPHICQMKFSKIISVKSMPQSSSFNKPARKRMTAVKTDVVEMSIPQRAKGKKSDEPESSSS